jgi:hypothetical protein
MSQPTINTTTFSATALRTKSREARTERGAARDAESKEKQDHLRSLIDQYCNAIIAQLPSTDKVDELANKGHTSIRVHFCHPPMKIDEVIDGEICAVPVYPSELTHFAGFKGTEKEAAEPTDHSEKAVPRVALIQGFRPKDKTGRQMLPDPKTLPGGQTVVDLLNKWAISQADGKPEDAFSFRTLFRGKERRDGRLQTINRMEIHMIWDIAAWDNWSNQSEHRRKTRVQHSQPQAQAQTQTLDEFMAEREQHRQTRAARASSR